MLPLSLFAIGAVSYTTVNRNARDAQRKSDLKRIQLALEQFKTDNGVYPDEHGDTVGPHRNSDYFTCDIKGDLLGTALIEGSAFTCNGNSYLNVIPGDPKTGDGYLYETHENIKWDSLNRPGWCDNQTDPGDPPPPGVYHGNCRHYTLWTQLENTSDSAVFDPLDPTADPICKVAYDIEDWIQSGTGYSLNYCVHD